MSSSHWLALTSLQLGQFSLASRVIVSKLLDFGFDSR